MSSQLGGVLTTTRCSSGSPELGMPGTSPPATHVHASAVPGAPLPLLTLIVTLWAAAGRATVHTNATRTAHTRAIVRKSPFIVFSMAAAMSRDHPSALTAATAIIVSGERTEGEPVHGRPVSRFTARR